VNRRLRLWLAWLALAAVAGCAHPIAREIRARAANLVPEDVRQDPSAHVGATVVWGGVILETVPRTGGADVYVLQTPLDWLGMPVAVEYSRGRFIARSGEFLDPAIFRQGRRFTVGGEIAGAEPHPLGETQYDYPVVRIEDYHLWPVPGPPPGIHDWGWGWYAPYYYPYHDEWIYDGYYYDLGAYEYDYGYGRADAYSPGRGPSTGGNIVGPGSAGGVLGR